MADEAQATAVHAQVDAVQDDRGDRWSVALEATLLAAACALLLYQVGAWGRGSRASPWDFGFVCLLGAWAGPAALAEVRLRARGVPPAAIGGALGVLGCAWFVVAFTQVTYLAELSSRGTYAGAVAATGETVIGLLERWSETRTLVLAFAPAFGFAAWARCAERSLPAQLGLTAAGSALVFAASVLGFEGLPQVGWLLGVRWCHPILGWYLFLLPFALSLLLPPLPLAARAIRRRLGQRSP